MRECGKIGVGSVFFDAGEFRDYKEETLLELIKAWL
jgi:hypothetical protein